MAIKHITSLSDRPWEMQTEETERQYLAFCEYRDASPPISAREAGKRHGIPPKTVEKVCTAKKWIERRKEWEMHEAKIIVAEIEREIPRMRSRHIMQALELGEFGAHLLNEAKLALKELDGRNLKPAELARITELYARLMETHQKAERLARGEATERNEVSGVVILND